ncbi:MAG TPA: TIGR02466 family protein [Novosphingobium sp.]|nr:TIGR02466 family protein [Novosphingobium sp.]
MDQAKRPGGSTADLRQVHSIAAFATYVDEYAVADHVALNAELLGVIDAWRSEAEEGVSFTNHLGWHSTRTFFDRKEPAIVKLARHIRAGLAHSVKRYWAEFDPTRHPVVCEGWANVNEKGAFNAPHDHQGAHLSGSYYISMPDSDDKSSGGLEFLNPSGVGWVRLPSGGQMTHPTLFMRPKPGSIIIFPSYLRHWVYPNQEEAARISIAFNLRLLDVPKDATGA